MFTEDDLPAMANRAATARQLANRSLERIRSAVDVEGLTPENFSAALQAVRCDQIAFGFELRHRLALKKLELKETSTPEYLAKVQAARCATYRLIGETCYPKRTKRTQKSKKPVARIKKKRKASPYTKSVGAIPHVLSLRDGT